MGSAKLKALASALWSVVRVLAARVAPGLSPFRSPDRCGTVRSTRRAAGTSRAVGARGQLPSQAPRPFRSSRGGHPTPEQPPHTLTTRFTPRPGTEAVAGSPSPERAMGAPGGDEVDTQGPRRHATAPAEPPRTLRCQRQPDGRLIASSASVTRSVLAQAERARRPEPVAEAHSRPAAHQAGARRRAAGPLPPERAKGSPGGDEVDVRGRADARHRPRPNHHNIRSEMLARVEAVPWRSTRPNDGLRHAEGRSDPQEAWTSTNFRDTLISEPPQVRCPDRDPVPPTESITCGGLPMRNTPGHSPGGVPLKQDGEPAAAEGYFDPSAALPPPRITSIRPPMMPAFFAN